jgi:Na+-driven multidrug efflux pump
LYLIGVLIYMCAFFYSTRVSNELGAGEPQAAKLAARVVMCIALSAGLLLGSTMILLRRFWGYMYSNEPEVVTYIARMMPVLAISFFTDGLHSCLSGWLVSYSHLTPENSSLLSSVHERFHSVACLTFV